MLGGAAIHRSKQSHSTHRLAARLERAGLVAIVAVPASSVAAPLLDVLVAVSHLGMEAGGAIRELDINPLVVLEEGQGALGVDALVVLDIERCP